MILACENINKIKIEKKNNLKKKKIMGDFI